MYQAGSDLSPSGRGRVPALQVRAEVGDAEHVLGMPTRCNARFSETG